MVVRVTLVQVQLEETKCTAATIDGHVPRVSLYTDHPTAQRADPTVPLVHSGFALPGEQEMHCDIDDALLGLNGVAEGHAVQLPAPANE